MNRSNTLYFTDIAAIAVDRQTSASVSIGTVNQRFINFTGPVWQVHAAHF